MSVVGDAEARAVSVHSAAEHEQTALFVRALPEEHHGQRAVQAHIDARTAAARHAVPGKAGHGRVAAPDGRGQRIPLIGREEYVLKARVIERLHHAPAQAVVVDHGHGFALYAPAVEQRAASIGRAGHLLQAEHLRVVARNAAAQSDLSGLYGAFNERARLLRAPVGGIVVKEPRPLDGVAVPVVFGAVCGLIAQRGGPVEEALAVAALDVLRIVQPDVGVRGNHDVDRPAARRFPQAGKARRLAAECENPDGLNVALGRVYQHGRMALAAGQRHVAFFGERPSAFVGYGEGGVAAGAALHKQLDALAALMIDHRYGNDAEIGQAHDGCPP